MTLGLGSHITDSRTIDAKIEDPMLNIGYIALDIEKKAGHKVKGIHYRAIEYLLDAAEKRIEPQESYRQEEAEKVLETIHDIITDFFRFNDNLQLLSEQLESSELDCRDASLIYAAIANDLELPLTLVNSRLHRFVRWQISEDKHINWETTTGKQYPDSEFDKDIDQSSLDQGVYLQPLTRSQILSATLVSCALREGRTEKSKGLYEWAIRMDPKSPILRTNLGNVVNDLGDLDAALDYHNQAISLDPNMAGPYNNKGGIKLTKEDYDGCIEDCDIAIAKDPEYPLSYATRAMGKFERYKEKKNREDLRGALEDATTAINLGFEYSDLFKLRATIHETLNQPEKAKQDLEMYEQLSK